MYFFVRNCNQYALFKLRDRKTVLIHEFISERVLINAVWSLSWLELVIIIQFLAIEDIKDKIVC